jgi:polar amino acid transport system substrate-binding protein
MKHLTRLLALTCLLALVLTSAACTGTTSTTAAATTATTPATTAATTAAADINISTLADLAGKVVGTQLGTTGDTIANEKVKAKSVQAFKLFLDAITSLKQKKVDAVIMDRYTAEIFVKQNPDLVILDVGFDIEQYAIAADKGNTALKATIDEVLAAMQADGSLAASVTAHADQGGKAPDMNTGATGGKLVMGTSPGFPPFEYLNDENVCIGVDVDIMAQVAKKLNKKLVVESIDFDGLIPALNSGKIDAIAAGMTVTEDRKVNVDFSTTYFDASQVVVIRATSK